MANCVINKAAFTATSIECTLDKEPTCGDWKPIITTQKGTVPEVAALASQTVLCTITSIFPQTPLNWLGYDNITFTGTNFPHDLARSTIDIKFTDTDTTPCLAQSSTTTTLVCLTSPFAGTPASGESYGMTVIINSQTIAASAVPAMKPSVTTSSGLVPNSVSPVLKTKVQITLASDFPYTLDRADFTVNATSTTDATYVRYLNVVEVDDGAKTLSCMFGGAWSGTFQMSIRHAVYGLVDTTGMVLDVSSTVDSFTPQVGSIYGGTLLTITGRNFGTAKTDNPVKVSPGGGLGTTDCFVQTTSATEITCRINTNIDPKTAVRNVATSALESDHELIVFLKTSEEASCVNTAACEWTWTDTLPEVTTMSVAFDATLGAEGWDVVLVGTGFTGDAATVKFEVGGLAQTGTEVTATGAKFRVSDVTSGALASPFLYFPEGLPAGHSVVAAGATLEPRLTQISPNTGSIGGTEIIATVHGVGTATAGLELVDKSGTSICQTLTITAYS